MAKEIIKKQDEWEEMAKINEEVLDKNKRKKWKWGWYFLMGSIVYPVLQKSYIQKTGGDIFIYFIYSLIACYLYYKIREKYLADSGFFGFFVGSGLWLVFGFMATFTCGFLSAFIKSS